MISRLILVLALLSATPASAALTCDDLASIARAAALARAAGEPEESLYDRVPSLVAHLLADGESASDAEISSARVLASAVYRQRITAREASRRVLQQCGGRQA